MSAKDNAIVAKIRVVYGKRLREKEYLELVSRKTVVEVADFLKRNTHYESAFSGVDTSSIHRGYLESILNKAYFDEYERLCKFQQLSDKPFFNFLLVRSEMRELLKAILYLNNDNNDVYIRTMNAFLIKKASFDLIELAKAKNFKGVLNVIKHTPYYNILNDIRPNEDGIVPYTKCEIRLRTYYLKWMLEAVNDNFDKKTKEVLTQQIKVQSDIINIINAYRMKTFFGGDSQTLADNSLPFYGRLSQTRRNEIYEAETPKDFINRLSKTVYGRLMENLTEDMDSMLFEKELEKLQCGIARRALQFSDNAAVSLFSYMYLAEIEVKNLISIIESIRYGRSISYMQKLIVQT